MLVVTFGRKQVMQMMSSFFVLAYFVAGFIASLLNINEQIILLFFSISMLCIFLIYQKENKKSLYYNVEIRILAKTLELKAKLDTGNELKDSLFGDAVIVVSEECVKEELGEEIICILKNEKIDIPQQYQSRIKLITFQTIAEEGIKIGIKLDQIIIRTENQILESRAILILTDRKLKSCDALIGVNLLEGAYQYQIS